MRGLEAVGRQLEETPDGQISQTDPDGRSMKTRGSGIVGYNAQTAVDTKHHLIVAHEVTNAPTDRSLLSDMARQAKDAIGQNRLTVIAYRGYYKGEEILSCADSGITAIVPKITTSGAKADGRLDKAD